LAVRDIVLSPDAVLPEWERTPVHVFDGYTCPAEPVIVMPDLAIEAVMGIHGRLAGVVDDLAGKCVDGLLVGLAGATSEPAGAGADFLARLHRDLAAARLAPPGQQVRQDPPPAPALVEGAPADWFPLRYCPRSSSRLSASLALLEAPLDLASPIDREAAEALHRVVQRTPGLAQHFAAALAVREVLFGRVPRSVLGGADLTHPAGRLPLFSLSEPGLFVGPAVERDAIPGTIDAWLLSSPAAVGSGASSWRDVLVTLGQVGADAPRLFRSADWNALVENARLSSLVLLARNAGAVSDARFRMTGGTTASFHVAPECLFFDKAADWLQEIVKRVSAVHAVDEALLEDAKCVIAACRLLAAVARKQRDGVHLSAEEQQGLASVGVDMARGLGYREDGYMFPRRDHAFALGEKPGPGRAAQSMGLGAPQVVHANVVIDGETVIHRGVVFAFRRARREVDVERPAWRAGEELGSLRMLVIE
jgi:hypothetical protein